MFVCYIERIYISLLFNRNIAPMSSPIMLFYTRMESLMLMKFNVDTTSLGFEKLSTNKNLRTLFRNPSNFNLGNNSRHQLRFPLTDFTKIELWALFLVIFPVSYLEIGKIVTLGHPVTGAAVLRIPSLSQFFLWDLIVTER